MRGLQRAAYADELSMHMCALGLGVFDHTQLWHPGGATRCTQFTRASPPEIRPRSRAALGRG